jgi:hypothetical protein
MAMSYNPKQVSPCLISFSHTFFHGLGLPLDIGMTKEFETDIASSAGSVATLQSPVVGCPNAPMLLLASSVAFYSNGVNSSRR